MAEYEYIGDGRPDGTVIIRSATEKGAFFGGTPVVQPSGSTQAAVTSTMTTGLPTNTTLATNLRASIVLLNVLRENLVTLGLIKGGA